MKAASRRGRRVGFMGPKLCQVPEEVASLNRTEQGKPPKLFLLTTGSLGNDERIALFETKLSDLLDALEQGSFVELSRTQLSLRQ